MKLNFNLPGVAGSFSQGLISAGSKIWRSLGGRLASSKLYLLIGSSFLASTFIIVLVIHTAVQHHIVTVRPNTTRAFLSSNYYGYWDGYFIDYGSWSNFWDSLGSGWDGYGGGGRDANFNAWRDDGSGTGSGGEITVTDCNDTNTSPDLRRELGCGHIPLNCEMDDPTLDDAIYLVQAGCQNFRDERPCLYLDYADSHPAECNANHDNGNDNGSTVNNDNCQDGEFYAQNPLCAGRPAGYDCVEGGRLVTCDTRIPAGVTSLSQATRPRYVNPPQVNCGDPDNYYLPECYSDSGSTSILTNSVSANPVPARPVLPARLPTPCDNGLGSYDAGGNCVQNPSVLTRRDSDNPSLTGGNTNDPTPPTATRPRWVTQPEPSTEQQESIRPRTVERQFPPAREDVQPQAQNDDSWKFNPIQVGTKIWQFVRDAIFGKSDE